MIPLSALEFALELDIVLSFVCHFAPIDDRDLPSQVPRNEFKKIDRLFRIVVVWGVCNKAWFHLVPKYTEQPARSQVMHISLPQIELSHRCSRVSRNAQQDMVKESGQERDSQAVKPDYSRNGDWNAYIATSVNPITRISHLASVDREIQVISDNSSNPTMMALKDAKELGFLRF